MKQSQFCTPVSRIHHAGVLVYSSHIAFDKEMYIGQWLINIQVSKNKTMHAA